jgi:hypothetical protein
MNELKINLIEERLKYLNEPIEGVLLSDINELLINKPKDILNIDISPIILKEEILIKFFYLLCNMLKGINTEERLISIEILAKIIEL